MPGINVSIAASTLSKPSGNVPSGSRPDPLVQHVVSSLIPFTRDQAVPPTAVDHRLRHALGRAESKADIVRREALMPAVITGVVASTFGKPTVAVGGSVIGGALLAAATVQSAADNIEVIGKAYPKARARVAELAQRVEARREARREGQCARQARPAQGRIGNAEAADAALVHEEVGLLEADKTRKQIGRDRLFGVVRTGGLGGYTVATSATAAGNILDMAAPAAQVAAGQLGTMAGIATIVGTGAMAAYESARAAEKVHRALQHGKDQRALDNLDGELDPGALDATRQAAERHKHYHMAGAAFNGTQAVLQAVTLTGAALTLTGVLAPIGGPIAIAGVVAGAITAPIGLAINHKQQRFSGAGAGPEAMTRAGTRNTAQSIEDHGLAPTIQAVGQEMTRNQRTLVDAKLMSLVEFAVRNESSSGKATARRVERSRIDAVADLVSTGRKGPLTRTTLLKTEITAMQHRFHELADSGFFAGHKEAVLARGVDLLRSSETGQMLSESMTVRARVLGKTLQTLQRSDDRAVVAAVRRETGQKSRSVDENQLHDLAASNGAAGAVLTRRQAVEYSQAVKSHAAFGRGELTQTLVNLSKTRAVMDGRRVHAEARTLPDIESTYL